MAVKTYIRGFSRYPIDTLDYAASTNYFLSCAEALPDYGTYVDTKWVPYNDVVYMIIIYNTI